MPIRNFSNRAADDSADDRVEKRDVLSAYAGYMLSETAPAA